MMKINKVASIADKIRMEYLESQVESQAQLISELIKKQGYKVEEISENVFEFIKEDNSVAVQGDYLNPIEYVEGMECILGNFYSDGNNIWECIKEGIPNSFTDKEYFNIIEWKL